MSEWSIVEEPKQVGIIDWHMVVRHNKSGDIQHYRGLHSWKRYPQGDREENDSLRAWLNAQVSQYQWSKE